MPNYVGEPLKTINLVKNKYPEKKNKKKEDLPKGIHYEEQKTTIVFYYKRTTLEVITLDIIPNTSKENTTCTNQ